MAGRFLRPPQCRRFLEAQDAIIKDTVAIELLLTKDSSNPTLSRLVALALMNHIGPEVLKKAVASLGDDLKTPTSGTQ